MANNRTTAVGCGLWAVGAWLALSATALADSDAGNSIIAAAWDGNALVLSSNGPEAYATIFFKVSLGTSTVEWASEPILVRSGESVVHQPVWPVLSVADGPVHGIGSVAALVQPRTLDGEIIGHADGAPPVAASLVDGAVVSLASSPLDLAGLPIDAHVDSDEVVATVGPDALVVEVTP